MFSVVLATFLVVLANQTNYTNWDQKLKNYLMKDYDFSSMPNLGDYSNPTNVSIQIAFFGLKQIDQKNNKVQIKIIMRHRWVDPRLKWNKSDYNNIEYTLLDTATEKKVWTPDLVLRQMNGKVHFPGLDKTLCRVKYDGEVYWSRPGLIDLLHKFDLNDYPFDIQQISVDMESWANPSYRLQLKAWNHNNTSATNNSKSQDKTIIKDDMFQDNIQWELIKLDYYRKEMAYSSANYDKMTFRFTFKRRAMSIIKMVFTPGIMISSLSAFSYLLPMEGPVRIKFMIQVLLNMVVLTILLTTHLPITRSNILLVKIFQVLIFLIYSILVYILLIQKYRLYQMELQKKFQQIVDEQNLMVEKEKFKQAKQSLFKSVNDNNEKQPSNQSPRKSNSVAQISQSDIKKYQTPKIVKRFKKTLKKIMILKPHQFDLCMFTIIAICYVVIIISSIYKVVQENQTQMGK